MDGLWRRASEARLHEARLEETGAAVEGGLDRLGKRLTEAMASNAPLATRNSLKAMELRRAISIGSQSAAAMARASASMALPSSRSRRETWIGDR